MKRFRIEPARLKHRAKSLHGFRMNRLCSVERDFPAAQLQPLPLLRRDLADTEVIGKVGTACDRSAYLGDGLQPAEWLLQKRIRRQDHYREPDIERFHHAADQSHVVVRRKPGYSHAVAVA